MGEKYNKPRWCWKFTDKYNLLGQQMLRTSVAMISTYVETWVSTALVLKIQVFWDLTMCHWDSVSWCFQGTQCFHLLQVRGARRTLLGHRNPWRWKDCSQETITQWNQINGIHPVVSSQSHIYPLFYLTQHFVISFNATCFKWKRSSSGILYKTLQQGMEQICVLLNKCWKKIVNPCIWEYARPFIYEQVTEKHRQWMHFCRECDHKRTHHSPLLTLVILTTPDLFFAFARTNFVGTLCSCLFLTLDLATLTKSFSLEDEPTSLQKLSNFEPL
jgi:hypothetical protein